MIPAWVLQRNNKEELFLLNVSPDLFAPVQEITIAMSHALVFIKSLSWVILPYLTVTVLLKASDGI